MTPLVAYTAIYGGYEAPKVQPDLGVPLVLYTDDPGLVAPGWEVRVEPLTNVGSPMMRAKLWKCRPDLAVPEAAASIWIDGSMRFRDGRIPVDLLRLLGDRDALLVPHPWRDCIYEEEVASRSAPKYVGQPMAEQVAHYRGAGHPAHWGLFAANMLVRRANERTRVLGDAWFAECQLWSYQDQLSLPPLVRVMDLDYGFVPGPWGHLWTIGDH